MTSSTDGRRKSRVQAACGLLTGAFGALDAAHAHGMVHPGAADTQAVRATFFIDPNVVMRAMVSCPMSSGHSINEFVRLLQAMQASEKNQIAKPERWAPGCDVIVPPPKTSDAADERAGEGYQTTDW